MRKSILALMIGMLASAPAAAQDASPAQFQQCATTGLNAFGDFSINDQPAGACARTYPDSARAWCRQAIRSFILEFSFSMTIPPGTRVWKLNGTQFQGLQPVCLIVSTQQELWAWAQTNDAADRAAAAKAMEEKRLRDKAQLGPAFCAANPGLPVCR
jgi:hypothetical protein